MSNIRMPALVAGVVAVALGCATTPPIPENEPITLQLLHFADVDGNQDAAMESVDEFSAIVNGLRAEATYGPNTLLVSSGDNYIPGPRYTLASDALVTAITGGDNVGHLDTFWLNELGVAASALGNHELDQGPATFAASLEADGGFGGAQFPYLAANVDWGRSFDEGRDGLDVADLAGQVARSATVTVGCQVFGLVGAVTPTLGGITSAGDVTTTPSGADFSAAELAAEIQPAVDALIERGVNKIILLSHMQQIRVEQALAEELTGVDVIVAGGSGTLLADADDVLLEDDEVDGDYPLSFTSPTGEPVLVVNVSGDYQYLGRLVVSFDAAGIIDTSALDPALNGPIAATAENAAAFGGAPAPQIVRSRDAVRSAIENTLSEVVGYTAVDIRGDRDTSRVQESNGGNLTADANLWYANLMSNDRVEVSIKNGGGIRSDLLLDDLAGGAITLGDVATILAFNNGLAVVSVTAAELKDLLEFVAGGFSGIGADGALDGQSGSFPQVAGINVGIDPSRPARTEAGTGSRIRELVIVDDEGIAVDTVVSGGEIQGDAGRRFDVVSLNFLINGGSGWIFPTLSDLQRRNLYAAYNGSDDSTVTYAQIDNPGADPGNFGYSLTGLEQDALAEYLATFHGSAADGYAAPETAPREDRRLQILTADNPWVAPPAN